MSHENPAQVAQDFMQVLQEAVKDATAQLTDSVKIWVAKIHTITTQAALNFQNIVEEKDAKIFHLENTLAQLKTTHQQDITLDQGRLAQIKKLKENLRKFESRVEFLEATVESVWKRNKYLEKATRDLSIKEEKATVESTVQLHPDRENNVVAAANSQSSTENMYYHLNCRIDYIICIITMH